MDFLPENINQYTEQQSNTESKLLYDLNRATHQKVLQPRMLSGAYQGRLLSMISKLIQPKIILEVGTYTGYSALCLAEGLAKGGQLHSIEKNEELESIIKEYWDKSNSANQLNLHLGDACEVIPNLNLSPDLVFIDADKINYIKYYQLLIDQLKTGAIVLADNVLWSGKVLNPLENDPDTKALREFNQLILEDERVEKVMLPIRDGLYLIRKL